ncbi:uncharacterized protein LOC132607984 [Lycium barbarum]|uniref:uncharacterized protein LOC132607984 n=1 Tax=Lycium barbarum TaxID=112863 RepID=UPI00293E8A57|nr:uncharacterized protein LOC132607984 [Lycium barbarum]
MNTSTKTFFEPFRHLRDLSFPGKAVGVKVGGAAPAEAAPAKMEGEKRGKKTKKARETEVARRPPENLVIRDSSPSPRLPPRGASFPYDSLMNGIAYSLTHPYSFGRPYMSPR